MPIIHSNAIRIKRFPGLKATLPTQPHRLLLDIDLAKAAHVARVRQASAQLLGKQLTIPNTQAGFERCWVHGEQRRAESGVAELVCSVEPTGTVPRGPRPVPRAPRGRCRSALHHRAHHIRWTLDGTWGKRDPKHAHDLRDLLE